VTAKEHNQFKQNILCLIEEFLMNMHTQLDVEQATTTFKDKKRHLWLLGLAVPTIAMSGLAGYQFGPKKPKILCLFWSIIYSWCYSCIG
jgi:alkane 1-monooxygenase